MQKWIWVLALAAMGGACSAAGGGSPAASDAHVAPDSGSRDPLDAAPRTEDGGPATRDATAGDVGTPDAGDAGPTPWRVEVGTGDKEFEPLADGQRIAFTRGPQGGDRHFGFHIWSAVRVLGMNPRNIGVTHTISEESSGEELARSPRYTDLDSAGGAFVAFGFREIIPDCCVTRGKALIIRVEVKDADGKRGMDARRVIAADECPSGLPNPTIDPCAP